MRLSYPTNVKIIKVPCTGRVDITHVLKAFEDGADGVYLVGCLEGDCHYLVGNIRAKKRVEYLKHILDECGVGVSAWQCITCLQLRDNVLPKWQER